MYTGKQLIFLSETGGLFTKMYVRLMKKNRVTVRYVGHPDIPLLQRMIITCRWNAPPLHHLRFLLPNICMKYMTI